MTHPDLKGRVIAVMHSGDTALTTPRVRALATAGPPVRLTAQLDAI